MHCRRLILPGLLVMLLASLPLAALAESELSTTLIGSARMWEQKHRADLARAALDKLLAVEPDNIRALHLRGMVELRASQVDAAKAALKALKTSHPGHPLTRSLEDAVRVETSDRLRMAKARFLAKSSRADEAATAMREAFPNGPPGGDLGVEYWHAIGKSPKSWAEARNGLEKLIREEPDNPLPRLAMANLLARKAETANQALQLYADLAQRIDTDRERIGANWRELLDELGNRAPTASRQSYAQLFPQEALAVVKVTEAPVAEPPTVGAAATVPDAVAKPAIPIRDLVRLAEQRESESRYSEAAGHYQDAAQQDAAHRTEWQAKARNAHLLANLKEARALLADGDIAGAENRIQQTLDQKTDHPDALALLANIRVKQNKPAEAETLYRHVLSATPNHEAAFEGLLTLLEEGKRFQDAIALAEAHPQQVPALGNRLAGWTRDAADAELSQNRPSKAMALLERVLHHQPAQAWVRHDLARLYIRLGLPKLADAVMHEGLKTSGSAEMHYAVALVLSGQGRITEALQTIETIPASEQGDSITRLKSQLEFRHLLQQAATAPDREIFLSQAGKMAADKPALLADIAEAQFDLGDANAALSAMRDLELRFPSADMSLRYAKLLARTGNPNPLDNQLQRIHAMANLQPDQKAPLDELDISLTLLQTANLSPDTALAALAKSLENRPDNQRLLNALAEAKSASGEHQEAAKIYRGLIAKDSENLDARIGLTKALRKQGERKAAHRELDTALVRLEPSDIENHRAVARQYLALEDANMVRKVTGRVLANAPDDFDTLMIAARAEALDHQTEMASSLLERADHATADVADRIADVADLWIDLEQAERGLDMMQKLSSRHGTNATIRVRYAEMLDRTRHDQALAVQLASLSKIAPSSADTRNAVDRLSNRLTIRTALKKQENGDLAGARETVETALAKQPDAIELKAALAEIKTGIGYYRDAATIYREILAANPNRLDLRVDLAKTLRISGDEEGARQELDIVLAQAQPNDIDNRLSVTRQFLSLDDTVAARTVITPLVAAQEHNPDVLIHAGRVEKADRHYADAMQSFQQARQYETPDERNPVTGRTPAEREMAALNERRRYHIEAGMDSEIKRPGDPGISLLTTHEWPVKFSMPIGYDGQLFGHVDRVNLNAGALDPTSDAALDFGTIRANGANDLTQKIPHVQSGTMLGVGYETDDWRFDIGTTPREFLVSNIVGGILNTGDIGHFGYRINLSRRPMVGSQLSYAGMRDPVTRQVWGGVTKTGLEARISRDLGPFSVSAQAGRFFLEGKNVKDNTESTFRLAGDVNVIDTEHHRVNLGLTYARIAYAKNLSDYTFGHGGYYSPQYSRAESLPISWSARYGRFSWQMRYSRHWSRARDDTIEVYPTSEALQNQLALADRQNTGSIGYGMGYSWGIAAEYGLTKNLIVGTRFAKDRSGSEFYEPNYLNLYFRYSFDGKEAESSGVLPDNERVALPPSAIKPYSAY